MARRDPGNPYAKIIDLEKRVKRLERTNPYENGSVTNGRLRFIGGTLRIDSGGSLEIEGSFDLNGTTTITGLFTLSGDGWSITGDGEITGDLLIAGPATITGDVSLESNLDVASGGTITAGAITIDPDENGGSIKFSGGAEVYADGAELDLYSGPTGAFVNLNGTHAKINGPGTTWIEVRGSSIYLFGVNAVTGTGAVPGTLMLEAGGRLVRATS